MSKRLTETTKWADPWFRNLTGKQKLLWLWLLDNCDHAGVLPEIDWGLVSFQIGEKYTASDLDVFGVERIETIGKQLWLRKFIVFQYGVFDSETKSTVHKGVIKALTKVALPLAKAYLSLPEALENPVVTIKDKDKDKDKAQDKPKEPEGLLILCNELTKPEKRPNPVDAEIPEVLNTPEFRAAWVQWCNYRKERKEPLTPTGVKMQIAAMSKWGVAYSVATIERTIMKNWKGLLSPDEEKAGNRPVTKPATTAPVRENKIYGYDQ